MTTRAANGSSFDAPRVRPDHARITPRSGAFTLLELVLALSLMAVVIGLIVWGIDVHVRSLDARRNFAEEAQLAQAILNRIADDLRNIPVRQPIDLSSVEQLISGVDAASLLGDLEDAGLDGGDLPSGDDSANLDEMLDESVTNPNTTDIAGAEELPPEPGLYGNQFELQIDVSRLPRIDEYQPVAPAMPGALQDIPSDLKTVAYYVRTDPSQGFAGATGATPNTAGMASPSTGLIRRELSRAVTDWASQTAAATSLQQFEQVWAPEVQSLEFHYFDGTDWLYEWDSSSQGLPLAVEILLTMQPKDVSSPSAVSPFASATTTSATPRVYRLVVRLPQAKPPAGEESSDLEALGL